MIYIFIFIQLQGKGDMFTYWLTSEDKELRQRRLQNYGLATSIQDEFKYQMTPTVYEDLESPGPFKCTHSSATSDQQNFIELFRDNGSVDTSSIHSRSGSVKRRSSFDGRTSELSNRTNEMMNTNGCVYNLSETRSSVDGALTKYGKQNSFNFPPLGRLKLRSSKRRSRHKSKVPSSSLPSSPVPPTVPDIVVDKTEEEQSNESHRLLRDSQKRREDKPSNNGHYRLSLKGKDFKKNMAESMV